MVTNIWNTVKSWWANPKLVAQQAQPTIPLPVSVLGDKLVVDQLPAKIEPAPVETLRSDIVTPVQQPVIVDVPAAVVTAEPVKAPVVDTAVVPVEPAKAPVVETAVVAAVVASEPVGTKPVKENTAKAPGKPAKKTKAPRQETPAVVKKTRRGKSTAT
tara:strand:+ start:15506 stop:15979 length:474 start_codon:yes stop_codon:yes gene_type:complete